MKLDTHGQLEKALTGMDGLQVKNSKLLKVERVHDDKLIDELFPSYEKLQEAAKQKEEAEI